MKERGKKRLSITRLKRGAIIHGRWKEVIRRSRNRKLISIRARRGYQARPLSARGAVSWSGVVERVAFCAMSQRERAQERLGAAAWKQAGCLPRSDCWARDRLAVFSALLVFVIFTRRCAGIAAALLWLACVTRADAVTRAASRRAPRPFPFHSFPFLFLLRVGRINYTRGEGERGRDFCRKLILGRVLCKYICLVFISLYFTIFLFP